MKELVFLLEEASAKALIEGLLPRLVPAGSFPARFIVFDGKQDLERHLTSRLRGYLNPNARFIVLRDQDAGDCKVVKRKLVALCRKSGKTHTTVRIACRELEAFYLGDLRAVELGLGLRNLAGKQAARKFRNPDALHSPSTELLDLTRKRYQKVSGSRAIAPHLNLDASRSRSFAQPLQAIRRACQ